jgi:hypothetical protein
MWRIEVDQNDLLTAYRWQKIKLFPLLNKNTDMGKSSLQFPIIPSYVEHDIHADNFWKAEPERSLRTKFSYTATWYKKGSTGYFSKL